MQVIRADPPLTCGPMPSRVMQSVTREASSSTPSPSPSESEKSFVSAELPSDKPTSRPTKESHLGQSAKVIPSSQHLSLTFADFTLSPKHIPKTTSQIHNESNLSSPPLRPLKAPLYPSEESYFTRQPGDSGLEPRSCQRRRPPASRSSHGIETKSGPPPALSTQRSYTDSPRRPSASSKTRTIQPPLKSPLNPTNNSADAEVKQPYRSTNEAFRAQTSKPAQVAYTRPSTSDGVTTTAMESSHDKRAESDEDRDSTLRIRDRNVQREKHTSRTDMQEPSLSSHKDLFLDLARDDSVVEEPLSRSERRRSRVGASSFSQPRPARPASSGRSSTRGGNFSTHHGPAKKDHTHASSFDSSIPRSPRKSSLATLRNPVSRDRPYAASAHPLDHRRRTSDTRSSFGTTHRESSNEEGSPETPMPYGRRRSIRAPSPDVGVHSYKPSRLSYTSNGDHGSSPARATPIYGQGSARGTPQAEGTESTVSTTAPSTVWDELDDLKSRLRKLELTGLLSKSSNAAISTANGDRPATATTTVTTVSSSPKRRQIGSIPPEASTIKSISLTNLHPLLHSALAKAKPLVNLNLYRSLEATASDALTLAAMTGSTISQGASASSASAIGPANTVDRQLRRKADSMCRSLTELCICLAEELPNNETSKHRPGSGDVASTEVALSQPKLLCGANAESETRTSSRVMSRLEARRASLLSSSPLNGRKGSPQEATTPTQASTPISSRLDRTSSISLRKRSNPEEVDTFSSRRSLSRANTEISQVRPSPQTRISREYTSQHPMPSPSQQSPSLQSALPARKSYFASTTSSPLTPSVQPGNRRYLDRSTPPSSADSARLAEARQRRIASLGQGQSRIGLSAGRLKQAEPEQLR